MFNLVNPWEKKEIYQSVGLDHKWVAKEFIAGLDRDETARVEMKQQNNIGDNKLHKLRYYYMIVMIRYWNAHMTTYDMTIPCSVIKYKIGYDNI